MQSLPNEIEIRYVLGGLAPDSNEPMDQRTRKYIQSQWTKIQQHIPSTQFNDDFWQQCQPRRSTYPACRAVIAAKNQNPKYEQPMIDAIQQAYYLHAQNPSDDETLIHLASMLELDIKKFKQDLNADTTQAQLDNDRLLAKNLGVSGFPSLVLVSSNTQTNISIDYNHVQPMLKQILA